MKSDHLSEERVMEFFDGLGPGLSLAEAEHRAGCAHCAELFAEYERLYRGLSELPEPLLPEHFAAELVERLPLAVPPAARWRTKISSLGLGVGLMTLAVVVVLQMIYGLFSSWGGGANALFHWVVRQISQTKGAWSWLSGDTGALLLLVLLALGAVLLLDKLLTQKRRPVLHV